LNFNETLGKVNEKEIRILYLIFLFHNQLKLSVDFFFRLRLTRLKKEKNTYKNSRKLQMVEV